MNRRITALLIAIVVIALELGWHWYQALRSATPPLLPLTLPPQPSRIAEPGGEK